MLHHFLSSTFTTEVVDTRYTDDNSHINKDISDISLLINNHVLIEKQEIHICRNDIIRTNI